MAMYDTGNPSILAQHAWGASESRLLVDFDDPRSTRRERVEVPSDAQTLRDLAAAFITVADQIEA